MSSSAPWAMPIATLATPKAKTGGMGIRSSGSSRHGGSAKGRHVRSAGTSTSLAFR
jgi:hypothetical protein